MTKRYTEEDVEAAHFASKLIDDGWVIGIGGHVILRMALLTGTKSNGCCTESVEELTENIKEYAGEWAYEKYMKGYRILRDADLVSSPERYPHGVVAGDSEKARYFTNIDSPITPIYKGRKSADMTIRFYALRRRDK